MDPISGTSGPVSILVSDGKAGKIYVQIGGVLWECQLGGLSDCYSREYREVGFTTLYPTKYCFDADGTLSYRSGGYDGTLSGGSTLYSVLQAPFEGSGYYAISPLSTPDCAEYIYIFYYSIGIISVGCLDKDQEQFASAIDGILSK